jgi:metal-responsive CopG/Arc/MetJ family transcriptional regulator
MARVMVSIPDEVLKKVDRAAKTQRRSRAEVIRAAVRAQMSEGRESRSQWKKALVRLKAIERHWVGRWESTDIICYYRDYRQGRRPRGVHYY